MPMYETSIQEIFKFDRYDMILVKWADAMSESDGWNELSSYDFNGHEEKTYTQSIGFYINETEDNLFLCASINIEADMCGLILSIPKTTILSIKKLEEIY